ncbi:MAG: hypothetical protein JSW01_03920 [Candidatus Bathyarchaeota archaeon]|nr:MAG: hypothetical protein JSW01_03920 [Candidatus Bathyarchaeota archaeon]
MNIKWKDTRLIYLVIFLVIFGTSLTPITLPLPVVQWSKEFYKVIDEGVTVSVNPDNPRHFAGVKEGTRVMILNSGETAKLWGDMSEAVKAVWTDLRRRGAHILLWSSSVDNQAILDKYLIPYFYGLDPQSHSDYGVSFVDLGFVAGGNALLEQWRTSLRAITPVDRYGNSLADIPMMQNFDAMRIDCDLIIGLDARGLESIYVIRYNTPVLEMGGTDSAGYLALSYTAGYFQGMIMGQRGGAEYEFLSGIPGRASAYMLNSMAIALIVTVAIVVGNIQYLMSRRET